ncbi:unnamed protein product [Pelagomonas calceolata]|uniref:Cation/H+ exchanger transmembrane domain-containing protein n=1 Tax=Pelagomonas calceolata TaxID=35677 RepID=A0A8J2SNN5_9STRA|nr:unnamed protein product [Pelagomonas calceolata]
MGSMEARGAEQLEAGSPRRAEPASRLTMEAKSGEGSPRRAEPESPRRHSPRRHSPWGFAKALGVRDHEARFVPYDPWLGAAVGARGPRRAERARVRRRVPDAAGARRPARAARGPGLGHLLRLAVRVGDGPRARVAGLPPLAGQLLGGALARNSRAFRGAALTHAYKATIRAAGLGTIMTRSGLELDVGAIRRAGRVAARLTVLPGVSEALAVALFARWVFELPFVLALALGFILAAVSPAVVLVYVFEPDRLELVDNERWLRGDWRSVTLVRTRDDWEPAPAPPRAARVAATAAARRSAAPPASM